jgi:hypothetical protein
MNLYLVRGVMSDYTTIAVDNGPYIILVHTAVGHVNRVTVFAIRQYDRNGLFKLHHNRSHITVAQKMIKKIVR